jgi:hypothetical protein
MDSEHDAKKFNSLLPYEQNSFMAKSSQGDDDAIEINISVRYFFRANDTDDHADLNQIRPFFSYTSKSDFYWFPPNRDTRFSSPIVSRLQNPALHIQYKKANDDDSQFLGKWWDWVDLGVEHISNGQATDVQQNKQATIQAYNSNDRAYMDSISRVDAAVALTAEAKKSVPALLASDFKVKVYAARWGQESAVYWGQYANQNVSFNDFQLIRIQWGVDLPCDHCRFNTEMTMGSKGFFTDSWNFQMLLPVKVYYTDYTVPLAVSAHRGPMNNMSNYTESQNNFAMGIMLSF